MGPTRFMIHMCCLWPATSTAIQIAQMAAMSSERTESVLSERKVHLLFRNRGMYSTIAAAASL